MPMTAMVLSRGENELRKKLLHPSLPCPMKNYIIGIAVRAERAHLRSSDISDFVLLNLLHGVDKH